MPLTYFISAQTQPRKNEYSGFILDVLGFVSSYETLLIKMNYEEQVIYLLAYPISKKS